MIDKRLYDCSGKEEGMQFGSVGSVKRRKDKKKIRGGWDKGSKDRRDGEIEEDNEVRKEMGIFNSVIILATFINFVLLYFIHKISRKPAEEGVREGGREGEKERGKEERREGRGGDDGWEEGK